MILLNPYTPGAGVPPKYLAGREEVIKEAEETLEYIANGYFARSIIYYGLRGVGKTVLLNYIEDMASERNIKFEQIEIAERTSFKSIISLYILKIIKKLSSASTIKQYAQKALAVLKSFTLTYGDLSISIDTDVKAEIGISDTGNFQNDLTELFLVLGMLAAKCQSGVVLFIDEIQYLKNDEFEALIAAIHRVNQKALPFSIFAAGLPKIAKIAGDVKSYSERLFKFVPIGSLTDEAGRLALLEPAKKWEVSYTDKAVEQILHYTECYPYFLQEYGKQVWKYLDDRKIIDIAEVEKAYKDFEQSLDESFFKVRYDRATPRELEFMLAMVKINKLPCSIKDINKAMKQKSSTISPLRAQLIHKGFIYSVNRGELDFTVPQFDKYLKRVHGL